MHLPSFCCFTTKIYAGAHPVVEKSFRSHLDDTMSRRSHICFANLYELNTYFETSDGGLFVIQKNHIIDKRNTYFTLFYTKL